MQVLRLLSRCMNLDSSMQRKWTKVHSDWLPTCIKDHLRVFPSGLCALQAWSEDMVSSGLETL